MMIFLISFPDQEKIKILCVLRVFVVHFFFFEPQNVASEMFAQNVHRVEIGSQRSETVGKKLKRSKQRYPARVVGGSIAENLFNRGLCLLSGTGLNNSVYETQIKLRKGLHHFEQNRQQMNHHDPILLAS